MDYNKIKKAVELFLEGIGEDAGREELKDTPARVARMCEEIFSGMNKDPKEVIRKISLDEKYEELILVKDIPFYSICEHHLLPVVGKAHVAYISRGGVISGVSKFARVVDVVAKKPQLQERLTSEIADIISEVLNPYGVAVMVEAEHLCMTMRGVKKPGSKVVTNSLRGVFRKDAKARNEVLSLMAK
jgi:GTP cyclohydrolase I